MALRVLVCRADEAIEGALRGFAIPGVSWPVMITRIAGTIVATHPSKALRTLCEPRAACNILSRA